MFASARSLVSCSPARPASSTYSSYWVARTEATVGLHTSQPAPVPKRSRISSNERSCSTRTASNSSARVSAKCSHSAVDTSSPWAASSLSRVFFSSGTQEPQVVPARVQALTAPTSWHGSPSSPRTAARTVPALTLLQEHSVASSGRSESGTPSPPAAR